MGTSDHPPNLLITSNFQPRHLPLPTQFHHHSQFPTWTPSITLSLSHHFNFHTYHFPHHFQFHTWAPPITYLILSPLLISHPGTSNHLLPTHFPYHIQFDTWKTLIHLLLFPSFWISHLGTSRYPPKFATTPHFTPGHIQFSVATVVTDAFLKNWITMLVKLQNSWEYLSRCNPSKTGGSYIGLKESDL